MGAMALEMKLKSTTRSCVIMYSLLIYNHLINDIKLEFIQK